MAHCRDPLVLCKMEIKIFSLMNRLLPTVGDQSKQRRSRVGDIHFKVLSTVTMLDPRQGVRSHGQAHSRSVLIELSVVIGLLLISYANATAKNGSWRRLLYF